MLSLFSVNSTSTRKRSISSFAALGEISFQVSGKNKERRRRGRIRITIIIRRSRRSRINRRIIIIRIGIRRRRKRSEYLDRGELSEEFECGNQPGTTCYNIMHTFNRAQNQRCSATVSSSKRMLYCGQMPSFKRISSMSFQILERERR